MSEPITHPVIHMYGPNPCGGVAFQARRLLRSGERWDAVAIGHTPGQPLECQSCGYFPWAGDLAYGDPETPEPAG